MTHARHIVTVSTPDTWQLARAAGAEGIERLWQHIDTIELGERVARALRHEPFWPWLVAIDDTAAAVAAWTHAPDGI